MGSSIARHLYLCEANGTWHLQNKSRVTLKRFGEGTIYILTLFGHGGGGGGGGKVVPLRFPPNFVNSKIIKRSSFEIKNLKVGHSLLSWYNQSLREHKNMTKEKNEHDQREE